ncbi:MAG TPA: M14 family metallopeptidase [Candidatus Paceibacterota bacterium]|nr:M14 family metallopeptidase [Candidatus Paceibacterota bacterium]
MNTRAKWLGILGIILILAVALWVSLHRPESPAVTPPPSPPAWSTSSVIGTSVEGRAITAYTYGTGPTHILLVGGMHGGYEWNAVVLAYQVMDYLTAHPEVVPPALTVTIIPELNVDGVYKVTGKEGPFSVADVASSTATQVAGRFNADQVDLNRNFACHWQPTSTWQNKPESAGTAAFSEPEAAALRDFITRDTPVAVVFWHSASGSVYASECDNGVLPRTISVMNTYAKAAGYSAVKSFDAYPITGDSEGWLASIGIPAVTVELTSHTAVEFPQNLAGVKALFALYSATTSTSR